MKGILLISHGNMASGMINSASLFFGENIGQIDCLCLDGEENPDDFGENIVNKTRELDTGDGVVILADLYGGTPCNQALLHLNERVELITGMNFGILLELLGSRSYDVNIEELIETGKNGIVNIKKQLEELAIDDE